VPPVPNGYTRFASASADVVALTVCADSVRQALVGESLHRYAASHPERRELRGRGKAYAVPLPDGATRVVVRHSQHGGVLAPVTGDRFFAPTRAPHELSVALQLAAAGVPTPEVIAYATYPAWLGAFRRADVATREIVGGRDLTSVLANGSRPHDVSAVITTIVALLRALERAGARHPDLNLGNVLIAGDARQAFVIDVDRVVFEPPGPAIGAANVRRLLRSATKLRDLGRIDITDQELSTLALSAGHAQ
jgi:3-deoxy-D-manno-octulosonic acid kinase